jgi:TrwC relaxase/AAA domain
MLTYRTGAAGSPSAAKAMGEHLLQQTLSPEMAAMAEYYQQGMSPPTRAKAAAARYRDEAAAASFEGARLDEFLAQEADRLAESVGEERPALLRRAAGAFVAAGLAEEAGSLEALKRAGLPEQGLVPALALEIEAARTTRDYSSATATPRRDLNPLLAKKLGIEIGRALTSGQVANLLNGLRADGAAIEGKRQQQGTAGAGQVFGMSEAEIPSRAKLGQVLAGRRVDGAALDPEESKRALRHFLRVLGAGNGNLTPGQRENVLSGRMADGTVLSVPHYHERMDTGRSRIGYVDLTFSAPKSVSVAWAFAPTEGERGMILQAHHDAIASVMAEIERQIGRARKGDGGKDGWEPGAIAWVSFDHYTARPTVGIERADEQGRGYTELVTLKTPAGRVAGDMQLHTHTAVMNAVLTESGRVGGLDLAELDGRIKEWGALYQAFLATNLRRHGVDVVLDDRTQMARLTAVPERVSEHFSKRTVNGTAAARAYAASLGLDWDSLDPARKIGLIKQAVQDPRGAKSDDLGDLAAWRQAAQAIRYHHRSILQPKRRRHEPSREDRLEHAYQAALGVFDKELRRRASLDGADARVAAAKGLIASGIEDVAEVNEVTRAFRERGVRQEGQATGLIWGTVVGSQGRARVGITTALHAEQEQTLVARARAGAGDHSAALTPEQIAAAVARFPELDFTSEHGRAQHQVMEQLGTGGRFGVAIGVAGSGKSTLLKPLVEAWMRDGRDVHGIALAWRQSDDLAETGIEGEKTRAVEAFLRRVEAGRLSLDRQSVVVIDELGLLGTRQLNQILEARERHGFQIVAIGDPKQMQSVEAGAVVELLTRALGEERIAMLGSSVRQIEKVERETTLMFRNGQTEEAVARKAANGTLKLVPGLYEEAVTAAVDLWQQRREANAGRERYSLSISAPTNEDAHRISLAIRERRREQGELGPDQRVITATSANGTARDGNRTYEMALAVGDRVRLFARTNAAFSDGGRGNIGKNGSVLEVAAIRGDGLVLRTHEGRDGLVLWETLRNPASGRVMLAYGEVLTTNTSQGSTVSEHIFALPAGTAPVSAFGAYTSGSRHREQSFIVVSEGAERAEVSGRRPLGDRREIRESEGRPRSTLPDRLASHRVVKAVATVGDTLATRLRNQRAVGERWRGFSTGIQIEIAKLRERPRRMAEEALGGLWGAERQRRQRIWQLRAAPSARPREGHQARPRWSLAERFARRRTERQILDATSELSATVEQQRSVAERVRGFARDLRQVVLAALSHVAAERGKQARAAMPRRPRGRRR